MIEYIQNVALSVLSSVFKIPVFLFVITEAAIGSLVSGAFQLTAARAFEEQDDYPNLQSDDGNSSEADSDSSVGKVNLDDLAAWDLGDEDDGSGNQAVLTDSRKVATSGDPEVNVISLTRENALDTDVSWMLVVSGSPPFSIHDNDETTPTPILSPTPQLPQNKGWFASMFGWVRDDSANIGAADEAEVQAEIIGDNPDVPE